MKTLTIKAIISIFSFILFFCPSTLFGQQSVINILLVSEEYEDATNADGSGLYWDIIRAVYERAGVRVDYKIMPYARGVREVESHQADAWVASYLGETDFAVYPKIAFDRDIVSAVFKKNRYNTSSGLSILKNKHVGWIRGYEYKKYLDVSVIETEINSRKSGILMVLNDRLDFFLDAACEIENEFQKGYLDQSLFDIMTVTELKLYIAFAGSPKGRKLAEIWDKRMAVLHDSGELKRIFGKHQDYTTFYPFK